jgi:hypothetical protein
LTLALVMVKRAGPVSAAGGSVSYAPQSSLSVGNTPDALAVGDLNGDGAPDLVTANVLDHSVSVRLGNGDGTFGAVITTSVYGEATSVAIGDLNEDGKPDLAVATGADNTVEVLLGNGDGTFHIGTTSAGALYGFGTGAGVGSSTTSVAIADLNGDGRPDLVTSNDSGIVSVLLANGSDSFLSPTTYAIGGPVTPATSIAVGDLNKDGKPDLVVSAGDDATGYGTVNVFLGNGDGTFATPVTYPIDSESKSVAIGDLNGDGTPDLVTANWGGTNVSVLLGQGDGTFKAQVPYTVTTGNTSPYFVAIGDLNGDGKLDLVTSNYTFNQNDGSVTVVLGNGDGTFGPPTTLAVDSSPQAVAIADLNRDGKPDLGTANTGASTVSVLLQTASTPTLAYVASGTVHHAGRQLTVHWRMQTSHGVVGFHMYGGTRLLTRSILPIHPGSRYHFTAQYGGSGPIYLGVVLAGGGEVRVALH